MSEARARSILTRLLPPLAVALVMVGLLWWSIRPPVPLEAVPALESPVQTPSRRIDTVAWLGREEGGGSNLPSRTIAAPLLAGRVLTLEGRAIVASCDGKEHHEENGSMRLILSHPRPSGEIQVYTQEIEVRRGQWVARQELLDPVEPKWITWRVEHVTLGGREVESRMWPTEPREFGIPDNRCVVLRGRWTSPHVLHVVAAGAAGELRDVEMIPAMFSYSPTDVEPFWPTDDALHPGAFEWRRYEEEDPFLYEWPTSWKGDSPVTISREQLGDVDRQLFWVRARGYAWRRVILDITFGGERTVTLEPESLLDVEIPPLDPGLGVRLVLYQPRTGVWSDLVTTFDLAEQRRLTIDGLRSGRYEVRAEIGDQLSWRMGSIETAPLLHGLLPYTSTVPLVLGSAELDLPSGETTHLSLECASPLRGEGVPFEGTLSYPKSWWYEHASIRITPRVCQPPSREAPMGYGLAGLPYRDGTGELITLRYVQGDPEIRRWSAGRVYPGEFRVTVLPFQVSTTVTIGPEGETNVAIALPEVPADLDVWLVDDRTGKPRPDVALWHSSLARPTDGDEWVPVRRFGNPYFSIRTAPGARYFLGCDAENRYVLTPDHLDLEPGRSLHEIRIRPMCRVEVRVIEEGLLVPTDVVWLRRVRIQRQDQPAPVIDSFEAIDGRGMIHIPEAGIYQVEFELILGFDPIPPQRVELRSGELTEVVVELRRNH